MLGMQGREQDLELGQAIDNAAGRLPDGWEVEIRIECGSATVMLNGPDGTSHTDFPRESLADEINEAVEHAMGYQA